MGSDFKSIPIIDISPLLDKINDPKADEDKGVLEVVRLLDEACREAGFFYVKGHGISDSLLKEVRDITRQFFHLPYEEKVKIKMFPATGYRGYQRIGENITLGKPDMHEAIDCYTPIEPGRYGALGAPLEGANQWPDYPPNFKTLMEGYINLLKGYISLTIQFSKKNSHKFLLIAVAAELSKKIMRGIALALGCPPDAFEGELAGDAFWVARLIGYPVLSDIKNTDIECSDVGCEAHTDYGLLTLVNQDDGINALQVRNRSGEWISTPPIPGTFVCNIGDMLKIWTNGLYESTLHRVVNNSPSYRVSVAFFYEPNFDAGIKPLEQCVRKSGGVARFGEVVYGEHLSRKVVSSSINGDVNSLVCICMEVFDEDGFSGSSEAVKISDENETRKQPLSIVDNERHRCNPGDLVPGRAGPKPAGCKQTHPGPF